MIDSTLFHNVLLICTALFFTARLAGKEIDIASPPAVIVVEQDAPPPVHFAGGELKSFLETMTAKEFTISPIPVPSASNIFLGKSKYSKQAGINTDELPAYGYIIKADKGDLYILGNDSSHKSSERLFELRKDLDGRFKDQWQYSQCKWDFDMGTAVGVWRFLETLGVRWLFPGPLGEYIPKKKSIRLSSSINIQQSPYFKMRLIGGNRWFKEDAPNSTSHYIFSDEGQRLQWSGNKNMLWILRQGGAAKYMAINHRPNRHFWASRFGNSNPEYFALLKSGKRNIPWITNTSRFSLCNSSEGMFEETQRDIDAFFAGKSPASRGIRNHDSFSHNRGWISPAAYGNTFSLLPHDTFAPCVCKKCQVLVDSSQPFSGQLSDSVWDFVKRTAETAARKHPDKYFTCLAYSSYSQPPRAFKKLPDNVIVGLCMYKANNIVSAANPEYMQNLLELSDQWSEYSDNKPFYWFHFLYRWNRMPRKYIPMLLPEHLGTFFRAVAKRSEDVHIEIDLNSKTYEFINRYVMYKLLWDPELDAGKVRDDFILHCFGPEAFASMARLLGDVESSCTQIAASGTSRFQIYKQVFNHKQVEDYQNRMNAALNIIKDPMQRKRAVLFEKYFFGAMRSGLDEFEKTFSKATTSNVLISTETKDNIELDEEIGEPAWRKAPKWDFYESTVGGKMNLADVKLLHDDSYLYFLFDLRGPNRVDHAENGRFGRVEICLDPNHDRDSYYKIQISGDGKMRDMFYQGGGEPPHEAWSSHAKYALTLRENGWSIKVVIPRASLGSDQNSPAAIWGINLCYIMAARPRQDRWQHSSTSPVMIGDLDQPDLFAALRFEQQRARFNLLRNSSFEEADDDKVVDWKSKAGGKRIIIKDAVDGNAAMSLIRPDKDSTSSVTSSKLTVKPGSFFEFTGSHRGINGSVYVLFYDKHGKSLPDAALTTYASVSTVWKPFRISGVIPPKAEKAMILLRSWSFEKTVLYDDLEFISEQVQ